MFIPLICGSIQHQEDDDMELLRLCAKKPSRKPMRWHSFGGGGGGRVKASKNPYANRGLDKFSALLAELDSKRQKIYTQKGSEDISLLGFVCSDSNDYKPIVVKLKDKKQQSQTANIDHENAKEKHKSQESLENKVVVLYERSTHENMMPKVSGMESEQLNKLRVVLKTLKNIKMMESLRRPSYYIPVIMILILLFLAAFGRSFTILCTTLGWYFIPRIQDLDSKKTKKVKKEYVKALSYNNKFMITSSDHGLLSPHPNLKSTKTAKKNYVKAFSYNNKVDHHGYSSPKSVLAGEKSPPQLGSPLPQDHRRSF